MRGLPGSGKSTEAKKWAAMVPGAVIVSADHYMFGEGREFQLSRLQECHDLCFKAFEEALKNKTPLVIVDNTNTKFSDVVQYTNLCTHYGYAHTVLQIHVTLKVAFERNIHGVPLETLKLFAQRMWSDRMPTTWDVWNKGTPWNPNQDQVPRRQKPHREYPQIDHRKANGRSGL